jgi:hypothetical protein
MRRLCFILSLCLLLPLTAVPAFAQEAMGASAPEGNKQEPVGASATEGNKQEAPATPAKEPIRAAGEEGNLHKAGGGGTQKHGKTEVITDEKTNTVRILVGGKEILTIDADGVQVNGNLKYTGYVMDNGGTGNSGKP